MFRIASALYRFTFEPPNSRPFLFPTEGTAEGAEQGAGLLVRARRGADDDVHPPYPVDRIVVDLRKDELFLQAGGEVAMAVEGVRVDPAEVPDARHHHVEQLVQEVPHPLAAHGDLAADAHPGADLERRD